MEPNTKMLKHPESKLGSKPDTMQELKSLSTPGLQAFATNVWIVDGPDVRDMGVLFTTRMTVVKLTDGSMWVDSPVPVPFDTLKSISELGPIRYLVAATPRHVWRLVEWHTLFPDAQLWTSRIYSIYVEERASCTHRLSE